MCEKIDSIEFEENGDSRDFKWSFIFSCLSIVARLMVNVKMLEYFCLIKNAAFKNCFM